MVHRRYGYIFASKNYTIDGTGKGSLGAGPRPHTKRPRPEASSAPRPPAGAAPARRGLASVKATATTEPVNQGRHFADLSIYKSAGAATFKPIFPEWRGRPPRPAGPCRFPQSAACIVASIVAAHPPSPAALLRASTAATRRWPQPAAYGAAAAASHGAVRAS